MKARVQHPEIHIDTTENRNFFFRYWIDEIQPDGSLKPVRKKHIPGPSKGPNKISHKDAETIRDDELRKSPNDAQREQMARARRAKQDKAKVVAIDSKETAA